MWNVVHISVAPISLVSPPPPAARTYASSCTWLSSIERPLYIPFLLFVRCGVLYHCAQSSALVYLSVAVPLVSPTRNTYLPNPLFFFFIFPRSLPLPFLTPRFFVATHCCCWHSTNSNVRCVTVCRSVAGKDVQQPPRDPQRSLFSFQLSLYCCCCCCTYFYTLVLLWYIPTIICSLLLALCGRRSPLLIFVVILYCLCAYVRELKKKELRSPSERFTKPFTHQGLVYSCRTFPCPRCYS